jgi:serine/threonine protein kinase
MDTTTDRRNLDDEQDKNSQDQGDSDDNKTLYEENTVERRVAIKQRTVVKTYPNESQLFQRPDGTIVYPYWAQERLRNEAATLALIAEKTTIPVPKGRLYMENGILHLETNRITEGVLMGDLDKDVRPSAVAAVDKQIQEDILPQLRSLRRNFIGSADPGLPVFPPSRVYRLDRRLWQRVTSDTDEFVLCHNDLGPQNIIVDPDDNFRIVAILDWEFAGFFPSYFEVPLWRSLDRTATSDLYAAVQDRELAFFGLKRGDLKECTADRPPFGWGSKA